MRSDHIIVDENDKEIRRVTWAEILEERKNIKKENCFYCGDEMWPKGYYADTRELYATRDHIVPRSKGGSWHKANLVRCCNRCNSKKSVKSYDHFRSVLLLTGKIKQRWFAGEAPRVERDWLIVVSEKFIVGTASQ